MKKSIVALLVLLAIAVLITPAIIGRLAERTVDEQIDSATDESGDVVIRSVYFDRGWFSSEGRHRVQFQDTDNVQALKLVLGMTPSDTLPALIIDTRLEHGPITLGTLEPGLGSAESTLTLEFGDGATYELPGTVRSTLALNGDLDSSYAVEPGSDGEIAWGNISIDLKAVAQSADYSYSGNIESVLIEDPATPVAFTNLSFSGDMTASEYGYSVGDFVFGLESMTAVNPMGVPVTIGPISIDATSRIEADELLTDGTMSLNVSDIPGFGSLGLDLQMSIDGLDAEAYGRLSSALRALPAGGDPETMLAEVEPEAMDLLARGANLRIGRLDISTPQGVVRSVVNVNVSETDRDTFAWTSLLLALEADLQLEIPEVLANMAMLMTPQANIVEGFLIRNGDVYELEAAYKRGVMTVNGAPLPIPIN